MLFKKILHMLLLIVLSIGIAGCYHEIATSLEQPPDYEGQSEVNEEPPCITEESSKVSESQPEIPDYKDTVLAITPDFGDAILEKKQLNSDTVGWLHIPDTTIDQVIVQKPDIRDNNYYLNVNFDGLPDKNGMFCADYRDQFGSGSRNDLSHITAIYGHSWDDDPDGELFAQLKKFRDPEFAASHPYIFFSTESENMVWEVFAVFETTTKLPYIEPILPQSMFNQMLNIIYASSIYDYHTEILKTDKLLTLSTCTFSVEGHKNLPDRNDYRFAIMARLVSPDEERKDEAVFSIKDGIMEPDATLALDWYAA